uniref:Beta/gamma crystallin 'Greek key' domain-containing protein n=1 Tax=Sinocyclocheilus anshuiensis TaxID=1608454 RepID=A0A671P9Y9_9TELE
MEASETEREVLSTHEPSEGSEAVLFEGSDGRGDGGTNAEHQFGVMLTDQTLSAVLEGTLAGHVDCSRSPPSSGYESIAGSDTDIRCIVGVASDVITTSAPTGSQNENQAVLENLSEEKNVDGTRKSSGRNSVLSAAADEPLSPNLHKIDIKLLSEESLWREQHTGDVSVCEAEWVRGEKRPQDTAKDNAMSNNCRLSLNGSCGTSGTAPSAHQESLQQSQILSAMGKSDPVSHSLASDTADADIMSEITQSHQPEKTEGSGEQEQVCRVSRAGIDSRVLPSVTEVHHPSQWATVQAFRCDVTDDQSLSSATLQTELSVNRADAGVPVVSVSGRRIHLDAVDSSSRTAAVVPQHSRFHDLELHQVDGGFAIISEEEESDMVFVNDMGPMHSPSARRAKAYPFSLSPIYEEEFGREEASGQQTLQVPPATEEEQRSVEQPASSILSLLQSVSEKLQSSVVCSSVEESVHAPLSGDDSEDDDEDSSILQSLMLNSAGPPGTEFCRPELEQWTALNGERWVCFRWVAYSERCFTGQQCVLEKGHYPGLLDWGAGRSSARSLRPIHRLRVYSQTRYSGQSREFESGVPDCGVPGVASLRVIRGRWLLFDEECYSGNQYILGEGHYPDLTSCGCTSTAIKSLKPIPYSLAEPSVSLFSLSGFEGLEDRWCSDAENMSHFFLQSVRVHSGLWVAYEYARFKGRQMLLQPGGYPVWTEHSGWDTIGSLKPLRQPKAYIQLRSRALGSVLTSESLPDGSFPAKLFLSPTDRSLDTQRWIFSHGLLKNAARGGCLSVIGAKACAGAPVALWEEHGRVNQRWSLNEDGSICSHLNRSLALDLRGGCGADRDHLIVSPLHADSATQTWDIDVL